jgi:hypothetical protein
MCAADTVASRIGVWSQPPLPETAFNCKRINVPQNALQEEERVTEREFQLIGSGINVYGQDDAVEGVARWLGSPQEVMDLISNGEIETTIGISRGGTTTFMAPALASGIAGLVTLQGAPESHLGILSREFGIPCVMSVTFTEGVQTDRGEIVPSDGTRIRLEVSDPSSGRVLGERADKPSSAEGTGAGDAEQIEGVVGAPEAAAEQSGASAFEALLARYRGKTPPGSEGDRLFRAELGTDVLELAGESLRREALTPDETDDMIAYGGWNVWDVLGSRATEGESGLIPRQEYESIAAVEQFHSYPAMFELITEAVGADGVVELAGTARREIGTKANMLHAWCCCMPLFTGRGITIGLDYCSPSHRADELARALQFPRRLYRGLWGEDGPMFSSMRGYQAPLLEGSDWLTRFRDEAVWLDDPDRKQFFMKFNASTQLLAFLLHFDNRLGVGDSGPYPTEDGGFLIVRDHFLHDTVYHWFDIAEGMPHAITQAMYFRPPAGMKVTVNDLSTVFTKPASYMPYLAGMAVYARDTWGTPVSGIRRVDEQEMEKLTTQTQEKTMRLYNRIAAMSRRDRIMAGVENYVVDFLLPWLRLAGVWEKAVERGLYEIAPVTSDSYYKLTDANLAAELLPRVLIAGEGFVATQTGRVAAGDADDLVSSVELEPHFPALHALALRGAISDVPGDAVALEAAGLTASTPAGHMLTARGHSVHTELMAQERESIDSGALGVIYERFLAANGPMKAACSRWHTDGEDADAQFEIIAELADCIERIEPAMWRSAELLPRFASYVPRLSYALAKAEAGEHEYVVSPRLESVHTVWMEIHEDYLQTLGRSREEEGSY